MALEEYRKKRDLAKSREPRGGDASSHAPVFVVQEHDASTHHFDFRLEIDGVLKSWSVPKGPSTDPREKRLAIQTEDHPLDYADFEGTIPADEYGGGRVIVWDAGSYSNLKVDDDGNEEVSMLEAWQAGHLTVWLQGEKICGGYALTRFRDEEDPPKWLLVKMDDAGADARRRPTSTEPASVLSQRTIEDLDEPE